MSYILEWTSRESKGDGLGSSRNNCFINVSACMYMYSGTSNKGPSERDNISTKDAYNIPKSVYAIHFHLPKIRRQPPYKGLN